MRIKMRAKKLIFLIGLLCVILSVIVTNTTKEAVTIICLGFGFICFSIGMHSMDVEHNDPGEFLAIFFAVGGIFFVFAVIGAVQTFLR